MHFKPIINKSSYVLDTKKLTKLNDQIFMIDEDWIDFTGQKPNPIE